MAKILHTMIRVKSPEISIDFYDNAFGLKVVKKLEFDTFTLYYLKGEESSAELELTHNHNNEDDYTHGTGYGHMAIAVDNLETEHERFKEAGYSIKDMVDFKRDGTLLAKFFFMTDPDGYNIEVMEKMGHYK